MLAVITLASVSILNPPALLLQGEVEAKQITVSSKVAGRIDALYIHEGDSVEKDQLLLELDSPEILAKLKQAQATHAAAASQRKKTDKGLREETIRSARNQWRKAEAAAELADKTYLRVKRLFEDGIIPAQKRDEAEAGLKMAKETAEAAKAAFEMAAKGAQSEDKDAARAMEAKAAGLVAEVQSYLDETRIIAPMGGEVAAIMADPGELVSPGFPIVSIINLDDVWVTFNLREDLLSTFKMGSTLVAEFPALDNQAIELRVNYIAALGDYATWRATKTSGDFDLKTFEVRAVPLSNNTGLRPGMTAVVMGE